MTIVSLRLNQSSPRSLDDANDLISKFFALTSKGT